SERRESGNADEHLMAAGLPRRQAKAPGRFDRGGQSAHPKSRDDPSAGHRRAVGREHVSAETFVLRADLCARAGEREDDRTANHERPREAHRNDSRLWRPSAPRQRDAIIREYCCPNERFRWSIRTASRTSISPSEIWLALCDFMRTSSVC